MTYTFWQSGILIGESDLEERSDMPRHRGGIFRPTPYGIEIFPRLAGILSAGFALKTHLEANGLSADDLEPDQIDELLETTAAGQKVIDVGRTLSEVEVRAPDGERLEFASLAFIDTLELQGLLRAMDLESEHDLRDLPPEAPRYVVSGTVREEDSPAEIRSRRGAPFPKTHRPWHN
jgi:hypothetical protein